MRLTYTVADARPLDRNGDALIALTLRRIVDRFKQPEERTETAPEEFTLEIAAEHATPFYQLYRDAVRLTLIVESTRPNALVASHQRLLAACRMAESCTGTVMDGTGMMRLLEQLRQAIEQAEKL